MRIKCHTPERLIDTKVIAVVLGPCSQLLASENIESPGPASRNPIKLCMCSSARACIHRVHIFYTWESIHGLYDHMRAVSKSRRYTCICVWERMKLGWVWKVAFIFGAGSCMRRNFLCCVRIDSRMPCIEFLRWNDFLHYGSNLTWSRFEYWLSFSLKTKAIRILCKYLCVIY